MEIRQSKQLHRHVLPVAGLLIALFTLTAVTLNLALAADTNRDRQAILNALTNNALHVKRDGNSLVKINIQKAEPRNVSGMSELGRSADISLSLQAK